MANRLWSGLLLLALLLPALAICQYEEDETELVWLEQADKALAQSKSEQKPLFVYLYAPSCKTCKKFDRYVLQNKKFIGAAGGYVLLRMKVKNDDRFFSHYADLKQKKGTPYVLLLSPDGELLYKSGGAKKTGEIVKAMKRHTADPGQQDKDCEHCDKDDCSDCDKK